MSIHQKLPFGVSLNAVARDRAVDAIEQQGRALPCSVVSVKGAIVQVKFEVQSTWTLPNVTVPVFGPEYVRWPIQKGDKGYCMTADAYLGGVSGLGGGVASLVQQANLSALVFMPIGNVAWQTVDGQAVVIYGPNGVTLRDSNSKVTFTLTPSGIVIVGNVSVKGDVAITGGLTATNDVVAGTISLRNHTHTSSTAGTATSGPH
jgi:hypothetical protein